MTCHRLSHDPQPDKTDRFYRNHKFRRMLPGELLASLLMVYLAPSRPLAKRLFMLIWPEDVKNVLAFDANSL